MNSPLPRGISAHLLEAGPHSPCLPEAQGLTARDFISSPVPSFQGVVKGPCFADRRGCTRPEHLCGKVKPRVLSSSCSVSQSHCVSVTTNVSPLEFYLQHLRALSPLGCVLGAVALQSIQCWPAEVSAVAVASPCRQGNEGRSLGVETESLGLAISSIWMQPASRFHS